jgi:glycine/serine hydroxymethyltransferase
MIYRPKLIICGASAYVREWDYARLRKVSYVRLVFFFVAPLMIFDDNLRIP